MKILHTGTRKILLAMASIVLILACSPEPNDAAAKPQGQGNWNGQRTGGATGGGNWNGQRTGGGNSGAWNGQSSNAGGVSVQTVTVSIGTLVAEKTSSAVVVPAVQSQVAAQQGGVIARVVRNVGDWVRTGETVAALDETQLKLTLKTAQANLENAKINLKISQDNTSLNGPKLNLQLQSAQSSLAAAQKNYASAQALYKLGGNSGSDVDNALAALQQAQANLETAKISLEQNKSAETQNLAQLQIAVDQASLQVQQAELNLSNASIKAPFYGQIAQINVAPGSYVSSNTSVFLLVSAEHFIAFNIPPSDAPTLAFGSAVIFQSGGTKYAAKINMVPSAPVNGQVPMTASLSSSSVPVGTLGVVSYSLTLGKGLLIPLSTLQSSEDKTYVFEVQSGKTVKTDIVVLSESGDEAIVTGLNVGAQIVVSPPPGLLAGAAVQPLSQSSPSPSASNEPGKGSPASNPQQSPQKDPSKWKRDGSQNRTNRQGTAQ